MRRADSILAPSESSPDSEIKDADIGDRDHLTGVFENSVEIAHRRNDSLH